MLLHKINLSASLGYFDETEASITHIFRLLDIYKPN